MFLIASLGSKLTDGDNDLARLRENLADANRRADAVEFSLKMTEKKANAARSDHDSALQEGESRKLSALSRQTDKKKHQLRSKAEELEEEN